MISPATVAAAQVVANYFNTNPCSQDAYDIVETFQRAWNGDYAGSPGQLLTVDGQYGPLTQGALETALGTSNVPPNCFGGPAHPMPNPPAPGPLPPVPVPPPGQPTTTSSGNGPLPYLIAAVVVAGALAAYTYSKKSRKR